MKLWIQKERIKMSLQTIRTETYIETANTDVLLERIEHMRKLLQDKDKEIRELKENVNNYERIIGHKFRSEPVHIPMSRL